MPDWWDWNAIAAIGQCVGAAATFAAVWVALRAERRQAAPTIRLTIESGRRSVFGDEEEMHLIEMITNETDGLVTIAKMGALTTDDEIFYESVIPKGIGTLSRDEKLTFLTGPDILLKYADKAGIQERTKLRFFVEDSTGKRHWQSYHFDPKEWAPPSTSEAEPEAEI